MKPLHAAALTLGFMVSSSCANLHTGPTAADLTRSENEYEECMRTSAFPSECAEDKHIREFNYQFAFHSEVLCHPAARSTPN